MTALRRPLARVLDPVRFAAELGWTPDAWQADVLRSNSQYEVLNVHRQGGKSTTAAVRALHAALTEPGSLVIVISPSQRQSTELYRTIAAYWRSLGRPVGAEVENVRSLELVNGSRILSLPGDPDTVRGLAAVRLLVIDEASRVSDDLMTAVRPMVAVSGGQVLALSTPWGRRGWWFRAATGEDRGWRVTTVTAASCPRLSAEFLDRERAELGPLAYASEYECAFVASEGGVFAPADVEAAFVDGISKFDPQQPLERRHPLEPQP